MKETLWRAALVGTILVCAHAFVSSAGARAVAPPERRLATLPALIDGWRGEDQAAFDAETLRILAADDYLNRVYVHPTGAVAGLYVAYYGSQRTGESIHSPLHCLPGNGWRPISSTRMEMATDRGATQVNRLLVEKSTARQLVLYWFEGRGRSVASEYTNKAFLVWDGVRRGRSDGALVRIITPVLGDERAAEAAAIRFARQAFGPLREVLQ
jgi:EpsI family protein